MPHAKDEAAKNKYVDACGFLLYKKYVSFVWLSEERHPYTTNSHRRRSSGPTHSPIQNPRWGPAVDCKQSDYFS